MVVVEVVVWFGLVLFNLNIVYKLNETKLYKSENWEES